MSGSLRPIDLGVPDITVVVRENSDANRVLVDVPNISVNIEKSPDYKVSVQPSSLIKQRTGSLPSLAVSALFANTASYALITSGTIDTAVSSSYAVTASYAQKADSVFPFSGSAVITGSLNIVDSANVTGSTITPKFVNSEEFRLRAGNVTLTFTGSVNTGIFGATEFVLPFIPTSSFSAATVEYVASRQGGIRVGMILSAWSGSSTTVTDISSTDVGDTSDIRFSVIQDGGYIKLRVESLGSGSYPWTVQSLFKLFPTLS